MPSATVTLASTTLASPVDGTLSTISVASTANITPGQALFVDRELMRVVSIGVASGINKNINVLRGRDGSVTSRHAAGQMVWIGRGDQFYDVDPKGSPPAVVPVLPYINVLTGDIWTVMGDDGPPQSANRWWALQNTYQNVGPLGVRSEQTGTIQPNVLGQVSVTNN